MVDIKMLDQLEAEFPEHTPRPADAPKALEGIRVVDFSHFIAGPLATMILADMGAEVIKIEAPGRGDDLRRYPPVHPDLMHGAPFLWTNRNKRSVAIDLKSPEGLQIVRDLIDNAVLMTGYAPLQHLFSDANPQRNGNTSPDTCPSGVFQAQDRAFYINCGNDKIFQRLMSQVVDRPDLASAVIYATGPDRIRRRDDLFRLLG